MNATTQLESNVYEIQAWFFFLFVTAIAAFMLFAFSTHEVLPLLNWSPTR